MQTSFEIHKNVWIVHAPNPILSMHRVVFVAILIFFGCWFDHVTMYLCFGFQDLLNEARLRLSRVAKDPSRYQTLLDGLLLQVRMAQLLATIS